MSSNRLKYDDCSYKTDLSQSVGPLEYVLNPSKYENCQKCRHEFGLLGVPLYHILKEISLILKMI